MAIFILEDQLIQAESLKNLISEECAFLNHFEEAVFLFTKSADFLSKAVETCEFNLYFLDIQLKDELKAGLDVARSIRQFDTKGLIVFVTTHSELASTSYEYYVSALTFIEKSPDIPKYIAEIRKCLSIYFESKKTIPSTADMFVYQTKTSLIRLPFNDIFCFTSTFDHRILLEARTQIREFFCTLNDLEKTEERLLRVHHSYLVNPENIVACNKSTKELTLANGKLIPISRKYYKKTVELLQS